METYDALQTKKWWYKKNAVKPNKWTENFPIYAVSAYSLYTTTVRHLCPFWCVSLIPSQKANVINDYMKTELNILQTFINEP